MDHITAAMEMVDHMPTPAFCVCSGTIVKVNPAASARMIEAGNSVSDILETGWEEYEEFRDGCLLLTLSLCGQSVGACVRRKKDFDLFTLEHDTNRGELQALALAARELRGPLSGIMITADRLFPASTADNDEVREQISRVNRSLSQMVRIISNMSDANRYCYESVSRKEIRDVCSLIQETVTKVIAMSEQSGIHWTCEIHPEPMDCLVDEEKLERAVFNILSNALKFTPHGGEISVRLIRRGKKLYFSVQDSGCGIEESVRGGLFSRYSREPGLEEGRFGIGLGLVLIRAAAAAHGGTVLVDHPASSGTRVTMSLSIDSGSGKTLASPILKVDYAGGRDHALQELSDILSHEYYNPNKIN